MFSYSILLLFFLQMLTSFVAANYAFGLLHKRLPLESASALLMLSPLLLLLPLRWSRGAIWGLVLLVVVARLAYPLLDDTRVTMVVSGIGVSACLILLPSWLRGGDASAALLAGALALMVAASIALRAIGSGTDASTMGVTQLVAWPLGLAVIWARPAVTREWSDGSSSEMGRVVLLCTGMLASLTLLHFGFSAPSVMARWTGVSYLLIVGLVFAGLIVWSLLLRNSTIRRELTLGRLKACTAVFAALLILTVLPHQVGFSSDVGDYPIHEADVSGWSTAALVLTCLLAPVILVDFYVVAQEVRSIKPSAPDLAVGFGAGSVFLAAAVLAQILTVTYDYVPLIGPVFRDRFWVVLTLPAVCLLGSLLAVSVDRPPGVGLGLSLTLALVGLAALAIGGAMYVRADPLRPREDGALTIVTLNVQQGYSADNRRNLDGQLTLLKSFDADVIALQESDVARAGGGNDDLVRYFANELDMYSYYGPKTVNGTFGIALLSRYPIQNPHTFYLYSEGEQAAVISALLTVEGRPLHLLATHLGNGGPLVQQEEVLSLLPDSAVAVLGDFNFRPSTQQYRVTTEQLDDAWATRWPSGTDDTGSTWSGRIDYIFLSPGTQVRKADYVENRATDHPALVVEMLW